MKNEALLDEIMNPLYEKGYRFRPFQRETIINVVDIMTNKPDVPIIIDAPTGTGKSVISMVGSLLMNSVGKNGYILTSDIGLQNQYEDDILNMGFNIPSVKGIDNYDCSINLMKTSLGECRTKAGIDRKKLPCYDSCDYFSRRDRCALSKTALFNYSYWLLQMNFVLPKNPLAPFDKRDFCFFDEAHKIQDIVQEHFSPKISYFICNDVETYASVYASEVSDLKIQQKDLKNLITNIRNETSHSVLIKMLSELRDDLLKIKRTMDSFKKFCGDRWEFGTFVPSHVLKAQSAIDRISDSHCKIEDYIDCLEDEKDMVKILGKVDGSCSFKNLNETNLIKKTLLDKSNAKTFMSATIGNPETYAKFIGLDNFEYIEINNQFQLEKSPIFYFKGYKLNYKNIENNFNKVLNINDKIIDYHSSHRGIIHSSSFSIAKRILNQSIHSDRIITYESSKDKNEAIEKFKDSSNGILMGPSLLEGLSFDDDLSRFQIFFKVPFPSLSDEFMQKLLKIYPEKYSIKTLNNLIQGMGRSIRNVNDWAITYILDSCFDQFYTRKYLNNNILNRIKVKNIT